MFGKIFGTSPSKAARPQEASQPGKKVEDKTQAKKTGLLSGWTGSFAQFGAKKAISGVAMDMRKAKIEGQGKKFNPAKEPMVELIKDYPVPRAVLLDALGEGVVAELEANIGGVQKIISAVLDDSQVGGALGEAIRSLGYTDLMSASGRAKQAEKALESIGQIVEHDPTQQDHRSQQAKAIQTLLESLAIAVKKEDVKLEVAVLLANAPNLKELVKADIAQKAYANKELLLEIRNELQKEIPPVLAGRIIREFGLSGLGSDPAKFREEIAKAVGEAFSSTRNSPDLSKKADLIRQLSAGLQRALRSPAVQVKMKEALENILPEQSESALTKLGILEQALGGEDLVTRLLGDDGILNTIMFNLGPDLLGPMMEDAMRDLWVKDFEGDIGREKWMQQLKENAEAKWQEGGRFPQLVAQDEMDKLVDKAISSDSHKKAIAEETDRILAQKGLDASHKGAAREEATGHRRRLIQAEIGKEKWKEQLRIEVIDEFKQKGIKPSDVLIAKRVEEIVNKEVEEVRNTALQKKKEAVSGMLSATLVDLVRGNRASNESKAVMNMLSAVRAALKNENVRTDLLKAAKALLPENLDEIKKFEDLQVALGKDLLEELVKDSGVLDKLMETLQGDDLADIVQKAMGDLLLKDFEAAVKEEDWLAAFKEDASNQSILARFPNANDEQLLTALKSDESIQPAIKKAIQEVAQKAKDAVILAKKEQLAQAIPLIITGVGGTNESRVVLKLVNSLRSALLDDSVRAGLKEDLKKILPDALPKIEKLEELEKLVGKDLLKELVKDEGILAKLRDDLGVELLAAVTNELTQDLLINGKGKDALEKEFVGVLYELCTKPSPNDMSNKAKLVDGLVGSLGKVAKDEGYQAQLKSFLTQIIPEGSKEKAGVALELLTQMEAVMGKDLMSALLDNKDLVNAFRAELAGNAELKVLVDQLQAGGLEALSQGTPAPILLSDLVYAARGTGTREERDQLMDQIALKIKNSGINEKGGNTAEERLLSVFLKNYDSADDLTSKRAAMNKLWDAVQDQGITILPPETHDQTLLRVLSGQGLNLQEKMMHQILISCSKVLKKEVVARGIESRSVGWLSQMGKTAVELGKKKATPPAVQPQKKKISNGLRLAFSYMKLSFSLLFKGKKASVEARQDWLKNTIIEQSKAGGAQGITEAQADLALKMAETVFFEDKYVDSKMSKAMLASFISGLVGREFVGPFVIGYIERKFFGLSKQSQPSVRDAVSAVVPPNPASATVPPSNPPAA